MLIGNSTRGDSTAVEVAKSDAVYGGPSRLARLYCPTVLRPPAVTDRKVVGSFKNVAGATKSEMDLYTWLFYQHEIDSKVKKKLITLNQWKTDMTHLVGLGSKSLSICVTADVFVNSAKNPTDYLIPGITHWGVDFDGISSATGYHDYTVALAKAVVFAETHGLTLGVPELGANRATSVDPDGIQRAAWLTRNLRAFQDQNFLYSCFWEEDLQTGSTFTTPVEIAAVSMALRVG